MLGSGFQQATLTFQHPYKEWKMTKSAQTETAVPDYEAKERRKGGGRL